MATLNEIMDGLTILAEWRLEETSGTVIADYNGVTANNLAMRGSGYTLGASTGFGGYTKEIAMTGASSAFTNTVPAALKTAATGTLFYMADINATSVLYSQSAGDFTAYLQVAILDDGRSSILIRRGGNTAANDYNEITGLGVVPVGARVMIALVQDGTGIKTYVEGQGFVSTTRTLGASISAAAWLDDPNYTNLHIGASERSAAIDLELDGAVAGVGIVTDIMTATQLDELAVAIRAARAGSNLTGWIEQNGAGGQVNEAWMTYMRGAGASGGTYNELMYNWLGGLGYTGSLPDRLEAWSKINLL
jgi:hypothetical protein